MPRTLTPLLEQCLERANPDVAYFVEISQPDQSRVFRRAEDQLLATPPLISITPGSSAIASPSGAITLASAAHTLVNQFSEAGGFNIPQEDLRTYFNSVAWKVDPAFPGAILRSVSVRIKYLHGTNRPDLTLQIFRAVQQAGSYRRNTGTSLVETEITQTSFAPLLPEPVVRTFLDLFNGGAVDGAGFATVVFDLRPYRLQVHADAGPPPGPGETGDLHELYFTLQTNQQSPGNLVEWRYDTTSSRALVGIGSVRELSWTRDIPDDPSSLWHTFEPGRALTFKLETEAYVPTSQLLYTVTLPALPLASSVGRIVFISGELLGTDAVLELSTAGSSGPWTVVQSGDLVATHQLTYHMRLTLTASGDQQRAPVVSALGIEFRAKVDLSAESTIEHMAQEVEVPFLAAGVAEGKVSVVRTGRRDYRDPGSDLAGAGPDTLLEADIYLGSRHPRVTRTHWFHTARAMVSNRQPTPTAESFSLLSIAKMLKKKIPAQVETINTVHTVTAASTTQVTVTPNLTGVTIASPGNEYDGKKYRMRVRSSVQAGVEGGTQWVIEGNTGLNKLDFIGLFGTLIFGDEIEVHSGQYALPPIEWINADPADVWWEILTVHLGVPSDRIGLADVRRGGMPPHVTERTAPGDVTTQAKLLVTFKLTEQEDGDALIDQLSFLMGGTTIEIAGQIVFRQIYPLRDQNGIVRVPGEPVGAVFDARDLIGLETPTGRESRISLLAGAFGVDTTALIPNAVATIVDADADAIASFGLQDVDGLGTAALPTEISRWCFNSQDGGELLAFMLVHQVVLAASTGVRVWSWGTVDAHPELTVGDSVVIVTDQYTDYDPAKRVAIVGPKAYPMSLVSVSDGGRRFRGFMQGLAGITNVDANGGYGTVLDQAPTIPLAMRIDRQSATDGQITLRVYVADPSPTVGAPITITVDEFGVDAVLPDSVDLALPVDLITDDLDTTDYAEFIVTPPAADQPQGRVSITAKRTGRLPAVQSLDVLPRGAYTTPVPDIGPTTAEATAFGGGFEGMVHLPIVFEKNTAEIRFYSAESISSGIANPDISVGATSGILRRQEGVIESDDDWATMWDIETTPDYFRKVLAVAVGPTGLQSDPFIVEIQAVDTGVGPTAAPTAFGVVMSTNSGLARATLTWTNGDATASTRVKRNAVIVAILAPGVTTFVDDGMAPGATYHYGVDHYKNGQTTGSPDASIGSPADVPTLSTPGFAIGYPYGFMKHGGVPAVGVRVTTSDPTVETQVWQSPGPPDSGVFTLLRTLPAGTTDTVLSSPTPDLNFIYLVATKPGYIDSPPSAHVFIHYGG